MHTYVYIYIYILGWTCAFHAQSLLQTACPRKKYSCRETPHPPTPFTPPQPPHPNHPSEHPKHQHHSAAELRCSEIPQIAGGSTKLQKLPKLPKLQKLPKPGSELRKYIGGYTQEPHENVRNCPARCASSQRSNRSIRRFQKLAKLPKLPTAMLLAGAACRAVSDLGLRSLHLSARLSAAAF